MFNWFKKDKNKDKDKKETDEDIVEELESEDEEELISVEEVEDVSTETDSKNKEEVVMETEEDTETDEEESKKEDTEIDKETEKKGFFDKIFGGLSKTRKEMSEKIGSVLSSYKKIDEELFEDLEEILVTADVGVNTTMTLIDRVRERVKSEKVNDPQMVKDLLKDEMKLMMKESVDDNSLNLEPSPAVMLVVGVNGVGKTTTIGKLSNTFKQDGKKVLIAAADTFRAAAIEQLEEWSNRFNLMHLFNSLKTCLKKALTGYDYFSFKYIQIPANMYLLGNYLVF